MLISQLCFVLEYMSFSDTFIELFMVICDVFWIILIRTLSFRYVSTHAQHFHFLWFNVHAFFLVRWSGFQKYSPNYCSTQFLPCDLNYYLNIMKKEFTMNDHVRYSQLLTIASPKWEISKSTLYKTTKTWMFLGRGE